MSDRKVYLMNKDVLVASFIEHDDIDISYELIEQSDTYMPYGYSGLGDWIKQRQAAKHQKHIKELMGRCGCDTTKGFIDMTRCLSLNDTFWVKTENDSIMWKDVSLYSNKFNEMIAHLAFDGIGMYDEGFSTTSPELTTDGSFPKCWVNEGSFIYLLKRGNSGAVNLGWEPYSEVLAHQLLDHLGYNHVPYSVVQYRGKLASKCPLVTTEEVGFVPAGKMLYGQKDITFSTLQRLADKYGCIKDFEHMCLFDYVSCNTDRHLGNWGFLVDNDAGQVLGFMPLFDHNYTFFPGSVEGDTFDYHFEFSRPSNASSFKALLKTFPKDDLRKLLDFKFTPIDGYPEWKLNWVNRLVHSQVKNGLM